MAAPINVPGLPVSQTASVYNPNAAASQPDPALLSSTTASILGLQATTIQNTTNAQAETVAAQGDTAEAAAYGTAAGIAGGQATVAQISGQVQQYQAQRSLAQTLGAQSAAVGGAGFTGGGTATDLMRSSLQQGAIAQQVIGLQTSLTEMGYTSAEAAAEAEQTAASAAAAQANVLGTAYTTAANTATANETAATTDLTNYLNTFAPGGINYVPGSGTGGNPLDPFSGTGGGPNQTVQNDQQLLKDLTANNPAAVQTDINTIVNPTPSSNFPTTAAGFTTAPANPFTGVKLIGTSPTTRLAPAAPFLGT